MSLEACARLVERGDPDRFRVAMAAPPAAREVLLPLYAFNLEVARAPWVATTSLLVQMRLQWWRDAVDAAAAGREPLAHEVAGPLGRLVAEGRLDPEPLVAVVEARRREADEEPMRPDEVLPYLEGTAGNLMWAGVKALGAEPDYRVDALAAGLAGGVAAWLVALPELVARGRGPADPSPEALRAVAQRGAQSLEEARRAIRRGPWVPALRAATLAGPILDGALRDPSAILDGRLAPSEGAKRARLLWATLRNSW